MLFEYGNAAMMVRPKNVMLIVVLVALVACVSHFYIADRLGFLRFVYPLESGVTQYRLSCSAGGPSWLVEVLQFANESQASLANQVAYIAPDGARFHCENGWQAGMLRSPAITERTRFRYASISKLFTADLILELVNEGVLTLDTELQTIFPQELAVVKDERIKSITIRQLLNHSAGFDRFKTPDPLFEHYDKPWCPYNPLALADLALDFNPGAQTKYSNVGYCLLGMVAERVTGVPYRQLVENQIENSGIRFIDGPYLADEARYDFRYSDFYGSGYYKYFDFYALSSSAGLSGSAIDAASEIKRMINRSPLNILSFSVPDGCDAKSFSRCYGLVLSIYKPSGGALKLLIQNGFLPGTSSAAIIDDRGGITVWLGSGTPPEGHRSTQKMNQYIYDKLELYYSNIPTNSYNE